MDDPVFALFVNFKRQAGASRQAVVACLTRQADFFERRFQRQESYAGMFVPEQLERSKLHDMPPKALGGTKGTLSRFLWRFTARRGSGRLTFAVELMAQVEEWLPHLSHGISS